MDGTVAIVTISSRNYLAQVRTLFQSVREVDPGYHRILLLVDGSASEAAAEDGLYSVVEARELAVPEFDSMSFMYNVVEFSTALKPFAMRYLLDQGYRKVIYFDPDIMLFKSVSPVVRLLDEHAVILTPHITKPLPETESYYPYEWCYLVYGAYNLGFIALSDAPQAREMLSWWGAKCAREGFMDPYAGLFVDQKWVGLVPSLYDGVHILKDLGYNMAYWNLHERTLAEGKVNGASDLVFFHFSSFDVKDPNRISKCQSRYTLEKRPDLAGIFHAYGERLAENGYARYIGIPYGYGTFENGDPLDDTLRRLYPPVSSRYRTPFAVGPGTYHDTLRRKRIISARGRGRGGAPAKGGERELEKFGRVIDLCLVMVLKVLKSRRYGLLMRYLFKISALRNQHFVFGTDSCRAR